MIGSPRLARWATALMMVVVGSASLPAVDLYVTGWNNNTQKSVFGTIDSTTGAYSEISADLGTGFDFVRTLAWNPAINKFNTILDSGTLTTISTTGTVGSAIATGVTPGKLAYDVSTSAMYLMSYDHILSTIDTTTGAETGVGNSGLDSVESLAFQSGTLYSRYRTNQGQDTYFGTINLSSAAYTNISSVSSPINFDMLLASDGTTMYGLLFDEIYTINPLTGGSTKIATTSGAADIGFFAISTAVPEPSTYALGAIATGVMAAVARRRKARKA